MVTRLLNLIFRRNTDSVLQVFLKAQSQLEGISVTNHQKCAKLQQKAALAAEEANRADRIKGKLGDLLG